MTFAAAIGWSAGRALLIALAVWPICRAVSRWLQADDGPSRRWRWALVAGPFLFPELLVGYAYAPWVAGRPVFAEAACAVLMALRIVPVGVVAGLLTPPSAVTASALHCRQLMLRTWRDRIDWLRLWLYGPTLSAVPMVALVWLMAFQQFELAALVRAVSWSDWLFVQQVGGLSLTASLRAALGPAVGQLAILVIAFAAASRSARDAAAESLPQRPLSRRETAIATVYLLAAWTIVLGWPGVSLAAGLPAGFQQLVRQPLRMQGLSRELFAGLTAALVAALAAWWFSSTAADSPSFVWRRRASARPNGRWRFGLGFALLCLPGLCGSLLLGLALVAAFQTPLLRVLYNTPIPWVLGLVLYLLPRGALLQAWVGLTRARSAEFLAAQLMSCEDPCRQRHGRQLWWRLVEEPRFLAVAVLVYWGYLDLTTAYLLSPTGLSSGVVRLYNFMHFGRTAALSAEACVLLVGPLLAVAVLWPLVRGTRA